VGYGDISLKDAPLAMKLYGSFLMLCGAAILAALFSILTDFILQTRLRDVMAADRARSTGHVIVAGLGKIGFRLVRDLVRNGQRVVAIERREEAEFVQSARELAPVVLGNAKAEETLLKAGAAGAKAVIAATDDDLANLSIALAAKRARADCRVVLRIFDSTLAEKMEQGLGVDAVLSVSAAAAPTFLGSVLCPDVLQGIVLCDHLVLVFHRTVEAGPPAAASSAASLGTNEAALLVKPLGASAYRPVDGDYRPRQGDRILGASWRRFTRGPCEP
jgi:Trk K+ transport system NAD-binding subunit